MPKRASYIRVLMLELNRIANHLLWLGPFLADVGAQTPFFYIFREREMIYDLWEAATGQRLINNNYFRIGGVAADLPWGWLEKCRDFCDWFGPKIDEYEKLITNNPIFRRRIEGLGTIGKGGRHQLEPLRTDAARLPACPGISARWITTSATTTSTGRWPGKRKATATPAIACASKKCASRSRSCARPAT